MNRIYRKLLLSLSVLLFLVLSPLVVLYALGYRINGRTAQSLPVGVLIVESNPSRSAIDLNHKPIGLTPRSVSNLSPGPIDLTVTKDQYIPWHKNINILPGTVIETRDIRLFPAHQSFKTILSNVHAFSVSPNRRLIAALTQDRQLHLIDEDGIAVIAPVIFPSLPSDLLWSPDNSSILIITAGYTSLIRLTDHSVQPVRVFPLDQAMQLAWDQRVPGRLYAITNNHDFIAYSISNQSSQIIAPHINSFATSSRQLLLIDQDNQLQIRNLQGGLVDSPFIKTDQTIERLHVTPGGHIAFQFTDQSVAVLTDTGELLPVANKVRRLGWSPDEQILMIQLDDTSLHVMNIYDDRISYLPPRQLQLVTRLSRPISNPQWFAGGRHLIYQVNDEIMITEIDTRDQPLTYSVDTTNLGAANITVGDQGRVVYYLKKTAQQNRLVTARLTVEQK